MFQIAYPENKTGCPLATVIFGEKKTFFKKFQRKYTAALPVHILIIWEKNEAT